MATLASRAGGRQGTLGGAALAVLSAALGLGTAFGLHLTTDQQAAILSFATSVATVAPLVGALLDHARATTAPPALPTARDIQAAALDAKIAELSAEREKLGVGSG